MRLTAKQKAWLEPIGGFALGILVIAALFALEMVLS
jgi:hypothetical protein